MNPIRDSRGRFAPKAKASTSNGSTTSSSTPLPPCVGTYPPFIPHMICIDGMDGAGKTTVIHNLQKLLQDVFHKTVYVLDAPNYNSPSGKVIWDFLHEGTMDIRDRGPISLTYCVDRNEMMRTNFLRLFKHADDGNRPIILANRWALTNLIYQTTLFDTMCLADETEFITRGKRTMMGVPYQAHYSLPISPRTSYSFKFVHKPGIEDEALIHTSGIDLNLPTMWTIANSSFEDAQAILHLHPIKAQMVKDLCEALAPYLRATMVMDMLDLIYRAEITPWWFEQAGEVMPFHPFDHIRYVELIGHPGILSTNCGKRNRGGEGKDINESTRVQTSVLENIQYLYNRHDYINHANDFNCLHNFIDEYSKRVHHGVSIYFNRNQIAPYHPRPQTNTDAFDFDMVPVTTGEYEANVGKMIYGWSSKSKMRTIGAICKDVWKATGLEFIFGPIPAKFKFSI